MKKLTLLVLIILFLSGCSPAATLEPNNQYSSDNSSMPAAAPAPTTAFAPTPGPALPTESGSAPGSANQLAYAPAGSGMVIKDAEMELLVDNTDRAISQVTQTAADSGGYIIDSQTWYAEGYKYAKIRLGIPSLQFEKMLNTLRDLAIRIVTEKASGQDVSSTYVDLQSKLTNLEATADRVRDFLKDAKTIDESLKINQQLADLEGQIEQVKGQMNFYEGRSAYSTVTVDLDPQFPTPTPTMTMTPTVTPTSTPNWNPGATFHQASTVLESGTQATVDTLIWIIVVLGPIAVIILLVLFIFMAARKKLKRLS
ncbi:MAG: DUF4349 domain-containing protein [Anaerolineaceae bacterium]|nr:DUF4349 domain-containing protein [Anaerolineaceae bacterium]